VHQKRDRYLNWGILGKFLYLQKNNFMHWQDYIHSDNNVLCGKPVIRGTRLSIEFLLERLANGWTEEMLLENYPRLSKEALQAVFLFLKECVSDQLILLREPLKIAS
jgi:uncharacterized protein (DUF433 family)